MGGWVSFVLGNLSQRAYSPPQGGGGLGGWVVLLFLVFPVAETFLLSETKNQMVGPTQYLIPVLQ